MPQPDPAARRLTEEAVAWEAGADPAYVRQLVESGALQPDVDGLHASGDVARVRLALALADGGIDLADLTWAVRTGILSSDRFRMWAAAEPTGRTYAEFVTSLGARGSDLDAIHAAFGLAVPPPSTLMRRDEEEVLTDFLEVWSLVDPRREVALRAARIVGEGVRRTVQATLDLFDEFGGSPPQRARRGYSEDEAVLPSMLLSELLPRLLGWLQGRHAEHEVFERIVSYVEGSLERAGRIEPHADAPPAIAFVDLAGYTELTLAAGDERAATLALTLQALAEVAAHAHGGRVVKLLGDGVMLRYASASGAVGSVQGLMVAIEESGLPPAHAGIAEGPIIVRDGDVYGHTVNLAARIAGHATAGQLLVPRELAERLLDDRPGSWEDAGVVQLKGVEPGVPLVRVLALGGSAA